MPRLRVFGLCVLCPLAVSALVAHRARSSLGSLSDEDGMVEGRANIMAAQLSFNAGSQPGETPDEAAVREDIAAALQTPSVLGKPVRSMPRSEGVAQCLPDVTACPEGWSRKGALCFAHVGYTGPCSSPVAMDTMSTPGKMAYVRQCKVSFPCQADCDVEERQPCPSLWREVEAGVCQAPSTYVGECKGYVNVSAFTNRGKQLFSLRCGARWPCRVPTPRIYHAVCPDGWTLQFGQVCSAPPVYTGPCSRVLQMRGATVPDKLQLEAACNVAWPSLIDACERDYASPCPLGWLEMGPADAPECRAPLGHTECGIVKSFAGVGPDGKQVWAHTCGQTFPCRSRDVCKKDYGVPCPAGWFTFNGGVSCLAPRSYSGSCLRVLAGLAGLPASEKEQLQSECGFSWPCLGEVAPSGVSSGGGIVVGARSQVDLAQYVAFDGPIAPSGTVG